MEQATMISKPGILMIGATGRNTGKTEFACRIISACAGTIDIIGLKVTVIERDKGGCPRGHESCGVCDALKGDYEIITETDCHLSKDTSRMLAAGARKVFWLKADKDKLQQAGEALFKQIPPGALVVCESNSLRNILDPGLFVVMRNTRERTIKESCLSVIDHANKIIGFSGRDWDFDPGRISMKEGRWIIRQKATAIVLAGGKSSRMGWFGEKPAARQRQTHDTAYHRTARRAF
jgi:hypothetical protein